MRKVSIKGVLVGGIVDIVATNLLVIPFFIYVIVKYGLFHKPAVQTITAVIHGNPSLYAVQLLIGFSCTALGGYISALLAKHDELLNGSLSSFLGVALGVYSLITGKTTTSLQLYVFLLIASPVVALFGGYLRTIQIRACANKA